MSKIPPEHDAARSLEESFRRLGAQRAAQQWRPRRSLPFGRVLAAALGVLLAVSAAAAGTKVLLRDGGTVGPESLPPGTLKPSPADRRVAQATSADPVERAPWGLRLYSSTGGRTCVLAGRLVGGRIGLLQGTRFTELPSSAPGMCSDLARDHVLATVRGYGLVGGGRTVLYGVADRTVSSLAFRMRPAVRRPIPIAADGTFIVVLEGHNSMRHARLVVHSTRGTSEQPLGG
ncbi:MAG TPA: hypothetical protein VK501_19475 [Baekduia sp.]|uniref:hypothetical protein n=1 Tax=Baekduia sp. TaxID=2600305 RepID=UPI002BF3BB52|nr:hypothetical protein [Baekduia sp.]HMJ36094.1 hypothetical protein [Baekduia sp.]